MFNETKVLQDKIYQIMRTMDWMDTESRNIEKAYWATETNTYVGGLSADADPATTNTRLSKKEFVDGITLCGQIKNFFSNAAVLQADNQVIIENIRYADTLGAADVPTCAEEIGQRLSTLCLNILSAYDSCRECLAYYDATEISDMVGVLASHRGVFGSSMTVQTLSEGMTCIDNFKKLINNEVATQGDYRSTVQKWMALAYNT